MSKSKNNGIDPQHLIDTMGADTARLFVMFASPPEQTLEWSGSGVDGSNRFLRRLWNYCYKHQDEIRQAQDNIDWAAQEELAQAIKDLRLETYSLLKQADYDYSRIQYNTVVSANMKLLNALEAAQLPAGELAQHAIRESVSILLRMLYPVVPHITWHLWRALGFAETYGDLLDAPWPVVDEAALVADEIELVLQINGKLRGSMMVPNDADQALIEQTAREHEAVERFLEGRPIKRVIVVPGRLVNVVG